MEDIAIVALTAIIGITLVALTALGTRVRGHLKKGDVNITLDAIVSYPGDLSRLRPVVLSR